MPSLRILVVGPEASVLARILRSHGRIALLLVVATLGPALGIVSQAQARTTKPSLRAVRAAVLPYVQRDITHLDRAVFYNDDPSCAPSCYETATRMPIGVYKIQAFIDLGDFNCRLSGGLAAFKAGHWSCDPVYDAFYFRGAANEWAGSGFCSTGFDVLPPRKGSTKLLIKAWSGPNLCLGVPDTAPAHELDGFEGRGTLAVNPLPPKAPTPIIPASVPAPAAPANDAPPPAGTVLPAVPHHVVGAASRAHAASLHYGCTQFPGTLGWSGPYWQRNYGVWAYVYAEDCRVPGYLLGLRGGVAHNLQWIVTVFYWNGYQPVFWYDVTNPEASGTDNEIGCTGSSVFCHSP